MGFSIMAKEKIDSEKATGAEYPIKKKPVTAKSAVILDLQTNSEKVRGKRYNPKKKSVTVKSRANHPITLELQTASGIVQKVLSPGQKVFNVESSSLPEKLPKGLRVF